MSSVSLVQGALNVIAYGAKYYTETLSTFYSTASHHIHMLHIYVSLPLPHLDHGFGHLLSRDPLGTPLANIDTENLSFPLHPMCCQTYSTYFLKPQTDPSLSRLSTPPDSTTPSVPCANVEMDLTTFP